MSNLKYKSPTSGKSCSCAQYLAELVTKRKADKDRVSLPSGWWNSTTWKTLFQRNIMAAHSLLKIFDEIAIIRGLKRKECSWCWTLNHKSLLPHFQEEQKQLEYEQQKIKTNTPKSISIETVVEIKPSYGEPSKRSKLD